MDRVISLEQYRTQYPGSLDYTLTSEGGDVIDNALTAMLDGDKVTFTFANEAVTVKACQATRATTRCEYVMYPGLCTEVTLTRLSHAKHEVYSECRNMVHQVSCHQEGRRH